MMAGRTVKALEEVAVPPEVVTVRSPVMAAVGTMAVIWDALSRVYEVTATPLKVRAVALERLVPVMTTGLPTRVWVGVKDVRVGALAVCVAARPLQARLIASADNAAHRQRIRSIRRMVAPL